MSNDELACRQKQIDNDKKRRTVIAQLADVPYTCCCRLTFQRMPPTIDNRRLLMTKARCALCNGVDVTWTNARVDSTDDPAEVNAENQAIREYFQRRTLAEIDGRIALNDYGVNV